MPRLTPLVLLAVCGCSSTPPRPAVVIPVATEPRPRSELVVAPADWQLEGSARVDASHLRIAVGCTKAGEASTEQRLDQGAWRLSIDYGAECVTATTVFFDTGGETWAVPLANLDAVMLRCPIASLEDELVRIAVHADGGLRCGGEVAIERVALEPVAASAWTAERCGWLRLALENALSSGGAASATTVIRDLGL